MVDLELELVQSGFQSSSKVPYSSLIKVSHTLLNLDTCLNRLESQIYQILLYDDDFERLLRNLDKVEDIYDWSTLEVNNRRVNNVEFEGRFVDEPTDGLYFGSLTYDITTQKEFDPAKIEIINTTADNFYAALFKRYEDNPKLTSHVDGFVTTKFGQPSWPFNFLFIPNYSTTQAFLTTCSRLEETSFSISIQHKDPDHIQRVIEIVDDLYSYCKFTLSDKRFTSLQWRSNSLNELEPEFWQGTIDYSLILEKDIT